MQKFFAQIVNAVIKKLMKNFEHDYFNLIINFDFSKIFILLEAKKLF